MHKVKHNEKTMKRFRIAYVTWDQIQIKPRRVGLVKRSAEEIALEMVLEMQREMDREYRQKLEDPRA